MKLTLRKTVAVAAATATVLAFTGLAAADQVEGDIVGASTDSAVVTPGEAFGPIDVDLFLKASGGTNGRVEGVSWTASKTGTCATVTVGAVARLDLPESWQSAGNGALSKVAPYNAKSAVSISGTAGSAGTSCAVTFTGSQTSTEGNIAGGQSTAVITIQFGSASTSTTSTSTTSTSTTSTTVDPCATAAAPAAPTWSPDPVADADGDNGWFTTQPTPTASSTTAGATVTYSTDGVSYSTTPPALSDGISDLYAKAEHTSCPTKASSPVLATYKVDTTSPGISLSTRLPAANGSGWNNTSVTVTWACSDGGSGPVQSSVSTTVATDGQDQSATGECADEAGNTASRTETGIDIDTVDPTITRRSRTRATSFGWNNTSVTVGWVCEDALSGPVTASDSETVSTDGQDQSATGECADEAGNTASHTETGINIDTVEPTIGAPARTPAPNGAGWHNTAVAVTWACSDTLSGVPATSTTVTRSAEGADQSAMGTCLDMAGNSVSDTETDIDIDLTDPGVVWGGDVGDHYFGFTPAAPTCTATDDLSGPKSCAVTGHGTTVGRHTLTATALDVADNSGDDARSYDVLAWTLRGFYQPVDMSPNAPGTIVWNTVKGGSTVPFKFEVFAGPTELTDVAVVRPLFTRQVACTGSVTDELEVTATGGTNLRYDSTGGQFTYNWQTPKLPGSCYQVVMTTADGSSLAAFFKLK